MQGKCQPVFGLKCLQCLLTGQIIKAQPEVTDDAVFSYLNEYFKKNNHCKCQKCDRELLDGYVELRIALLPIPIPFEKYKDIDKIYEKSIY